MKVDYKKFGLSLLVMFGVFYLIPQLISIMYVTIFHIDTNISDALLLKINIVIYIVDILFFIFFYNKSLLNEFKKINLKQNFLLALKYWVIGLLGMLLINSLLINFLGDISTNETQNRLLLANEPLLSLISMIFLGPIVEELTFRKVLKDAFNEKVLYCVISAFLFGLAHIIFNFDFNNLFQLLYIFPYAFLGYYFAKAYFETDSIYTSIAMHIFHNSFAILAILVLGGGI